MKYLHTPVMLKEVLEYLNPKKGQYFIDCTLGGGGYTFAIAKEIGDKGKILAIDSDKLAIENAKIQISKSKYQNIILAQDNFKNLKKIKINNLGDRKVDGAVFDLGLSSAQLEDKARGFSFKKDTPLNMAFGNTEINTQDIVNKSTEKDLEKIIKEYGEERFARKIAAQIIKYRNNKKITTTSQLVGIIASAIPKKFQHSKMHFATRTFQALRIATNNELANLQTALQQCLSIIKKRGRIVVVSYHSLEDRIVKHFFKKETRDCICPPNYPSCRCQHKARLKILTKKIVRAAKEEVLNNPRSRSAKLRAVEII